MIRSSRSLLALLSMLAACNDDSDLPGNLGLDAGAAVSADASSAFAPLPPGCVPFGSSLPRTLSCTGLYGEAGTGPAEKIVHPANRTFAPAPTLWTDGADKQRWIALPANSQIDTSNANAWVLPEGTRVWKEFAYQGRRIETRLMYKRDGSWNFLTYQWNDAQTEANLVDGAQVTLPSGKVHSIPKLEQCNECHRGSPDKLLGFQHVLLGLPNASGLNLAALAAENRLTHPPARTSHTIPDDGTGMAAPALSYLHVNCGVSCHNETGNAQANMSRMFLRISPSELEQTTPSNWNVVKLTVGVPSMTANFFGGLRIKPRAPDESVLIQNAQTRGNNAAMPPLGTNYVDTEGLATLREWITRLGGHDGGAPDAGTDASLAVRDAAVDAEVVDAGNDSDAEAADAGVDAELADAEVVDADAEGVDAEGVDAEVGDAEGTADFDAEVVPPVETDAGAPVMSGDPVTP